MSELRYELKFLVNVEAEELLLARLRGILHPDAHSGPDGYVIRSLYFDDPDNTAYYEKLDGSQDRSKLRLRFYNGDDSYIVLENKEKLSQLTRKTAQRVSRRTADALTQMNLSVCREAPGRVMDLFLLRASVAGLRPRVIVDYRRRAFVYPESDVRITLDSDISSGLYRTDLFGDHLPLLPVLDPGVAVLEVKFDRFLPEHLEAVLRDIPKARMAVSKYVHCLSVLE